jgi:hypothetical protein
MKKIPCDRTYKGTAETFATNFHYQYTADIINILKSNQYTAAVHSVIFQLNNARLFLKILQDLYYMQKNVCTAIQHFQESNGQFHLELKSEINVHRIISRYSGAILSSNSI